MAGIYIHIPFCTQRCHYCDFYSTTLLEKKDAFLEACLREIEMRQYFFDAQIPDTIYFGGGTPSVFSAADIQRIVSHLTQHFSGISRPEITLEANPDDLSKEKLVAYKNAGINRLSIGIQSFDSKDLILMNRRHTVEQAIQSIDRAHWAGFEDISIDLIYGLPEMDIDKWANNLDHLKSLPITHLSAYHLTYESNTLFDQWRNQNKLEVIDDQLSLDQFHLLRKATGDLGFEHYEISNFARDRLYSRHNMKYWNGSHYLGLGPAAHSFTGASRQWNPESLDEYIQHYAAGQSPIREETIDTRTARNEWLMTRLRTKWGIKKDEWINHFGQEKWEELMILANSWIEKGTMECNNESLYIQSDSWFIADGIIADLFVL